MKLRINEAIQSFNKIQKQQNIADNKPLNNGCMIKHYLAALLWPESNPQTQGVNLSNLIHGRTKSIRFDQVQIICRETKVDANFLFKL